MAGIPSSAIKFYTKPIGGTEITGGLSNPGVATMCYPRISDGFTESLTTANKVISTPYTGRSVISGVKYFSNVDSVLTYTASIPAHSISIEGTLSSMWVSAGGGSTSYDSVTNTLYVPNNLGTMLIKLSHNLKFIKVSLDYYNAVVVDSDSVIDIDSIAIDSVEVSDNDAYAVPNDTGRVKQYQISINASSSICSNVDNISHGYISFYGDNVDASTLLFNLNIVKIGAMLSATPASTSFNVTTGLGSSISIVSSKPWSII